MPWCCQVAEEATTRHMINYTLKAAPTASAKELKNQKSGKATRILVGADVHLRSYQAARKVDQGTIGVVENFRSEEALLLYDLGRCAQDPR